VVQINAEGKAEIKEFRDIRSWWDKHGDLLVKHFDNMGLLPG
jgi:hypothetical protein